jgi:hypothetical protein
VSTTTVYAAPKIVGAGAGGVAIGLQGRLPVDALEAFFGGPPS